MALAGKAPLYLRLRAGFAAILHESLFSHGAFYPMDDDDVEKAAAGGGSTDDERATLVLQLLLDSLEAPAPNLAHILLGFDVEDGPEGETLRLKCCLFSEGTSDAFVNVSNQVRWMQNSS